MTAPVLTPTGFVAPTTDEEVLDLNAKFLANVDASLDLAPDQPWGQIIGIFAQKLAEAYGLGATVYNAMNPDAAEGRLLVNDCALTGTLPQVATFSTVTVNMVLSATTTVHAGATMAVLNQPTNVWVLTADVTSTSAGTYPGVFRSQVAGPFAANATTLTVIGTPTVGWISGSNPADAVQGLPADTDAMLRIKRLSELAGAGSGDIDAIVALVRKIPGVISAFGFENTTLNGDKNLLPGKAFRIVVWDGAGMSASTAVIGQTIWNDKPSGIQSFGATAVQVTDASGNPQTVFFDRATAVRLYVNCTTTPATLTAAQTAAVKGAITAFALAHFTLGAPIIARSFSDSPLDTTAAYTPVVTDVPTFTFDVTPSPTNTANLVATGLQIFTVATVDVLVNGV